MEIALPANWVSGVNLKPVFYSKGFTGRCINVGSCTIR